MLEQHANPLRFWAFYTASGVAATGLTVTVRVWRNTTLIVTDAACTELASGQYYYDLAAASVTVEGDYRAVFHTAGTVDTKDIIAAWWVDKAGIEALVSGEVTVSSPVAQSGDVTIRRGKDYVAAIDTEITWTLTNPPGTTPSSVTFTCTALGISKTCTYSSPTITLELLAAATATYAKGRYAFEIEAVIATYKTSLVAGTLIVLEDV